MFALSLVLILAIPLLCAADIVPTAPGPGETFKAGGPCLIKWIADTSGKWKTTYIELMTGPNNPMVHLTTVASVDGTDPTNTSISIPCPNVSPPSPIYFYQFTALNVKNVTWTGRFTITGSTGATTPAPNATQPDGQPIPWGTGKLLDLSQASPPPPSAPSGQIDGSSGASAPNGTSMGPSLSLSSNSSGPSSSIAAPLTVSSASPTFNISSSVPPVAATTSLSATSTPSTSHTSSSPHGVIVNTVVTSLTAAAALFGLVTLY